jgi:hypothetical protein
MEPGGFGAATMDDGDASQQQHAPSGYGHDVPARSDIDEILRRKRKAREYKVRSRQRSRQRGSLEGRGPRRAAAGTRSLCIVLLSRHGHGATLAGPTSLG